MTQNVQTIEMVKSIKKCNSLVAIMMLHSNGFDFKVTIENQSDDVSDKVTKMLLGEDNEVVIETPQQATNETLIEEIDEPTQVTPQQPATNESPQQVEQDPVKKVNLSKVDDLTNALTIAYQRRTLKQAKVRTSARMALISVITQTTKMKLNDKHTAQLTQHIKDATSLSDLTSKVVSMMHPHHK